MASDSRDVRALRAEMIRLVEDAKRSAERVASSSAETVQRELTRAIAVEGQRIESKMENTAVAPVGGLPTGGTAGQVLTKASSANFDADWSDPVDASALAADVAALETLTSGHTTDIAALEGTAATHETEITALQTDVAALEATDTALQADIDAVESTVAGHTATLATHAANIGANGSAITALDTRVTTAEADITALEAADAAQDAAIAANAAAADAAQAAADDAQTAADAAQADVDALAPTVSSNTAGIASNATAISTNTGAIAALDTRVGALEADVRTVRSATAPADTTARWLKTGDNHEYVYDSGLGKWVGESGCVRFGNPLNASATFWGRPTDQTDSNSFGADLRKGHLIPRDIVITRLVVAVGNGTSSAWQFQLHKKTLSTDVASGALFSWTPAGTYTYATTTLNLDIDADEVLSLLCNHGGTSLNVLQFNVEFRYRG